MAKAATVKNAVSAVEVGTADGVHVEKNGANYVVAMGYSSNLLKKLLAVPGVQKIESHFGEGKDGYGVPATSAAELSAAVSDMRDFVRNNGVQVKEVGGDIHVLFDFNKTLTQEIGKVNKASFNQEHKAWVVPSNSTSLALAEGMQSSTLDMVVNKMRGLAVEITNDRTKIMGLAADSAQEAGMKPGISFAVTKGEHSYTGPIANVSGHYAAQKTGEKDGVAFMTIHDLSALGKPVFKGDSMRIDYNDGHVNVRSVETFEKQKVERAQLQATAAKLVDGAEVRNASTRGDDKKTYPGVVKEVTEHFVLQSSGRNKFTIHPRDMLGSFEPKKDQDLEISYQGGKGQVKDRALSKQVAQAR